MVADAPTALLGWGTALPPHRLSPEASREMLSTIFPRARGLSLVPVTRYTVQPVDPRGLALGEAMATYRSQAPALAGQAARRALDDAGVTAAEVDAIVTTSCTGYMVPSLDVTLVRELGLRPDVRRVPLTELGCSGGLAGLAIAHQLLAGGGTALVIAVELPSLNLQPRDHSIDNLAATMVFGDGAAAVVARAGEQPGALALDHVESRLVPASEHLLGFDLRQDGFHTVLDPALARVLRSHLRELVDAFWSTHRWPEGVAFAAVHAGGLKILDAAQAALGLDDQAMGPSRDIFLGSGNLSSASILFVLAEIARSAQTGTGLALAFGPGVTVEMARVRRS